MNTVPVTFSLPKYVHQRLLRQVPPRKRSSYAAAAISSQLTDDHIRARSKNPWKELLDLGKKLKLNVSAEQIIEAKNFGRK